MSISQVSTLNSGMLPTTLNEYLLVRQGYLSVTKNINNKPRYF